jgi:hypothetical protein
VSSLARKLLLLLCCLASEGGRPSPIYRGGRARRGRPGCTESPLRRHPTAGIGRRNVRTTCCARRREATKSLHRRRRTAHLLSVPHGEYYQLTAERFFLRLLQLHIP